MQSRAHSFFESLTNTAIGYGVAIVSQILVFPLFDIHVQHHQHFTLALWFTVISLVRSYVLRRIFTKRTENKNAKLT